MLKNFVFKKISALFCAIAGFCRIMLTHIILPNPVKKIIERGFSPKVRPSMLPVETKRQRVNMLSAVSSHGKVRFMIYQGTMNQQRLI